MNYLCLQSNFFELGGYSIRPVRPEDIMFIRVWRNQQINVLRQKKEISEEEQLQYFSERIWPTYSEQNPSQILVSFFFNNELIGYGGLVHISWEDKRGELSFLTNPERHLPELYEKDFSVFIALMKQLVFKDLSFHRIHGETYSFREFHISIMERNGFVREGVMKNHIRIRDIYYNSIIHGCNADDTTSFQSSFGLLFSSVSKKIPMIEIARQTLSRGKVNPIIWGADLNNDCLGKYFTDRFWHMPRLDQLAPDKLIDFCKANGVNAIVPTRDMELPYYAKHKNELSENDIHVMVSSPRTIEMCLDKLLFYNELHSAGFPAITTLETPELTGVSKWVVKDRYGAGSAKLLLNASLDEALSFSKNITNPIFQPYIKGKEYSVDCYVSRSGKVRGIVCRTRDLVVNGESQVTAVVSNPVIESLVSHILSTYSFYGHVLFQLIEDEEGKIFIIECNARFGGASTLSVFAGLDTFYWFFLECNGQLIDELPALNVKGGEKLVRTSHDKFYGKVDSF